MKKRSVFVDLRKKGMDLKDGSSFILDEQETWLSTYLSYDTGV